MGANSSPSGADRILAREQCSAPEALTNTDEGIINRLRDTNWWTIEADAKRDIAATRAWDEARCAGLRPQDIVRASSSTKETSNG